MRIPRHRDYHGAPGCAIEAALDVVGGKWKGVVLWHLIDGEQGFNALRRQFPEMSARVLSRQLQELETHGVVERRIYRTIPPRTGYRLTPLGRSLVPALRKLWRWGEAVLAAPAVKPTRRLINRAK